jgi:hypothetical protein
MAKYRVTVEFTTRLSREINVNSAEDAEQDAENMYREWKQGHNTHVIGTERHRSVELLDEVPPSISPDR